MRDLSPLRWVRFARSFPLGRRPDPTDLASVGELDLWLTPRLRRARAPSPAKQPPVNRAHVAAGEGWGEGKMAAWVHSGRRFQNAPLNPLTRPIVRAHPTERPDGAFNQRPPSQRSCNPKRQEFNPQRLPHSSPQSQSPPTAHNPGHLASTPPPARFSPQTESVIIGIQKSLNHSDLADFPQGTSHVRMVGEGPK